MYYVKCMNFTTDILSSVIAVITIILAGLSTSTYAQDSIKVGEYASMTGEHASYGISQNNGVRLAVDQINRNDGILGKRIELIAEDDQSKQGESTTIVRKLISQDHVVAILGEFNSSRSLEAAPIAQAAKIPMISTGATNPRVTQVGDYIFRDCYTDDFQGGVLARFVVQKLKARRIAVINDSKQDSSIGLSRALKERLQADGMQIVKELSYVSGDRDFRAQLSAVKASAPEVIVHTGLYPEASLIIKQARQLGIQVPFVGGDGWDGSSLIPVAGKAIEGCYFSNHYCNTDPAAEVQEFVQKYKKRYGVLPDGIAALGYDALMILADAMKQAGTLEPDKIREALAQTVGYQGVTGNITFDHDGNPSKSVVILTIRDGKYKFFDRIDPEDVVGGRAALRLEVRPGIRHDVSNCFYLWAIASI
jgi:branched-chain amino acid transport system substrate-binding protein